MNKLNTFSKGVVLVIVSLLIVVTALQFISHEPISPCISVKGQTAYPSPIYYLTLRGGIKVPGLSNVKPGAEKINVTELTNSAPLEFRHNLIDRGYDPDKNIWVLLSMNSMDRSGKTVHVEMLFDYDNDGNTDTSVFFPSYTTRGTFAVDNHTFHPNGRNGSFGNFRGMKNDGDGRPPGGSVTIRMWRTDAQNDSNLIIFCGAYNRPSQASIPYYEPPGGNDDGDGSMFVTILVATVIVLVVFYLYLRFGTGKKADPKKLREKGEDRRKKDRRNKIKHSSRKSR